MQTRLNAVVRRGRAAPGARRRALRAALARLRLARRRGRQRAGCSAAARASKVHDARAQAEGAQHRRAVCGAHPLGRALHAPAQLLCAFGVEAGGPGGFEPGLQRVHVRQLARAAEERARRVRPRRRQVRRQHLHVAVAAAPAVRRRGTSAHARGASERVCAGVHAQGSDDAAQQGAHPESMPCAVG